MIILYIILGLGLGFFISCALGAFGFHHAISDRGKNISIVMAIIIGILSAILVCVGLTNLDNNIEQEFIANFEAQKVVIEESIQNEDLTGYERIQLVNNAAELNGELAKRKVKIGHWYNFHIDDNLYNDVTPISLGTKEKK